MESNTNTIPPCPKCKSEDVMFSKKKQKFICEDCEHSWKKEQEDEKPRRTRKVFISYGRKDASRLAERVCADLEARGHTVQLDVRFMKTGESWEAQIEHKILESEVFLSLLSPHAVRRPAGVCLDEISLARYSDRMMVPCMVMNCRPPLSIYRLDWVDFQNWEQEAFYKRAFDNVALTIEGDDQSSDKIEGSHSVIFGHFKPLDFGRDIVRLTREFTGRKWLMDEIDQWYQDPESRVFLLTGGPGTGKSALAAQLIHKHARVFAYHFCISTLADSVDPSLFVRSIAAQLSTQLPDYCEALCALDLDQVKEWDASTQFRRLIIDPLKAESSITEAMIWVVDALDESIENNDAHGNNNGIGEILGKHLRDLPNFVKVIATTRPNGAILDTFSGFKPRELDVLRQENQMDLKAYLSDRLDELKKTQREEELEVEKVSAILLERSEGNFLYAVQAITALKTGLMDPLHPEQFPIGLIGIYRAFFKRTFPSPNDFQAIRPLLDVIVAARSYLNAKQIARIAGSDSFTVEQQLVKVSVFFPQNTKEEGKYIAYHKSIIDWLKGDVGRDLMFRVNVDGGHQQIADYLKRLYSSSNNDEWDDYLLNHYIQHLLKCEYWTDIKQVTCDMKFLRLKAKQISWAQVEHDFTRILDMLPQPQIQPWLADVRKAISSQIEDLQEQFVWSRVVAYWLTQSSSSSSANNDQHEEESIRFDLQGGKITDTLFETTLARGNTFDALCFAENSCWVYGRSNLFQQAADIAARGQESARLGLASGPTSELIQIQFLEVRARCARNLSSGGVHQGAALPLYQELQKRVSELCCCWDVSIDDLQKLEHDVGPFPPTRSSKLAVSSQEDDEGKKKMKNKKQVKVQLICNAYDAFNALYLVSWFELKGARVDWRHHGDVPTPVLAPSGYDISIILGGPLSPSMFSYNVKFKHLAGFMDLYRVDKAAFDVFKMRQNNNNILCCLAAGSTKFLTTEGAIAVTKDEEILSILASSGGRGGLKVDDETIIGPDERMKKRAKLERE
mmetsp:Transcript_13836/g.33482  ORF Transcript_13836/g.33482 Transcript_13836/m.33482 type:complete len:1018 (+) Transcript_13836:50-3103(+)